MSSHRNILIFNHSCATQFVDIANQYTRLFNSDTDTVTVVYLTGIDQSAVRQKTLAQEVIFLNCSPAVTRGLKISAIRQMMQLQKKKAFDIVICHRYKPTYIMLWVALFYRIPTFIAVMHELGTLKHLTRKLLLAMLAPKQMILAGVSNAVRNDLRQVVWRIPPGRVITLYNMIDVEWTVPQLYSRLIAREKLNLPQKAFVFGTLGRLVKNKDHKTLIAAFARIQSSCPAAQLIILGDGSLESELKQQVADLNLSQVVVFAGFVTDGFRYMQAFDVYVSSSIQEAFGRVLLEAMIANVPIIATRVNGMPEVLGSTGIIVEPSCPEQLAAAMLQAYQKSRAERINWGNAGYRRANEVFSIPCFGKIMNALLR